MSGEGRGKERARNIDWLPLARPQPGSRLTTQASGLRRDQTGNPSVCGPALSPLSHTSQGINGKTKGSGIKDGNWELRNDLTKVMVSGEVGTEPLTKAGASVPPPPPASHTEGEAAMCVG